MPLRVRALLKPSFAVRVCVCVWSPPGYGAANNCLSEEKFLVGRETPEYLPQPGGGPALQRQCGRTDPRLGQWFSLPVGGECKHGSVPNFREPADGGPSNPHPIIPIPPPTRGPLARAGLRRPRRTAQRAVHPAPRLNTSAARGLTPPPLPPFVRRTSGYVAMPQAARGAKSSA